MKLTDKPPLDNPAKQEPAQHTRYERLRREYWSSVAAATLTALSFPLCWFTGSFLVKDLGWPPALVVPVAASVVASLLCLAVWMYFRWMRCQCCGGHLAHYLKADSWTHPMHYCPLCGASLDEF